MSSNPAEKSDPLGAANSPDTWATNNRSFLVRIWREADDAPWRASLTDVHSKKSRVFGTVQALFLYLHEQITGSAQDK